MVYKCEICPQIMDEKSCRDASAWDWFTGYLDRTVHFCEAHRRGKVRRFLFDLSRKVPIGYIEAPSRGRDALLHSADSALHTASGTGLVTSLSKRS
jgi:hypothetical protein